MSESGGSLILNFGGCYIMRSSLNCWLVLVLVCWLGRAPTCGAQSDSEFKTIATIVGNGRSGPAVHRGRALEVALANPFGIQPESDGSLIVASQEQHAVYRVDASYRQIERIAGTGAEGQTGREGEFPLKVALNQPHEIQVDASGNVYVADTMNHRVGMIDAGTGRWTPIAGTGQSGFAGDGGPATEAQLDQAYSIAVSGDDLFIADLKNHRIRRVDLVSRKIETICGATKPGKPVDGQLAISQPLLGPRSLAVDEDNLWIVLREGNSVWRIDRHDNRIYHVAGTGEKGFAGDGGLATQATFRGPKGLCVQPGVAVYVADTENHAIRRIDLESGRVSTVVGGAGGKRGFNGDGDELRVRQLSRPHGLCLLPSGELLIGDSENHRVRILTP